MATRGGTGRVGRCGNGKEEEGEGEEEAAAAVLNSEAVVGAGGVGCGGRVLECGIVGESLMKCRVA